MFLALRPVIKMVLDRCNWPDCIVNALFECLNNLCKKSMVALLALPSIACSLINIFKKGCNGPTLIPPTLLFAALGVTFIYNMTPSDVSLIGRSFSGGQNNILIP